MERSKCGVQWSKLKDTLSISKQQSSYGASGIQSRVYAFSLRTCTFLSSNLLLLYSPVPQRVVSADYVLLSQEVNVTELIPVECWKTVALLARTDELSSKCKCGTLARLGVVLLSLLLPTEQVLNPCMAKEADDPPW